MHNIEEPHVFVCNKIIFLKYKYKKILSAFCKNGYKYMKIGLSFELLYFQIVDKTLVYTDIISTFQIIVIIYQNFNVWKSFKVYHWGQKRPSPYYSPFFPYIYIPHENKSIKNFQIFHKYHILDHYNFRFHHNHP